MHLERRILLAAAALGLMAGLASLSRSSAQAPASAVPVPDAAAAPSAPDAATEAAAATPVAPSDADPAQKLFRVPPPPFSKGVFPCSECHEPDNADPTPRAMKEKHKKIKLDHDEENRWCLDCHDMNDRDRLHLASGKLIEFEESYRLCGQCHGEKLRDWKAGVHGKRTGSWNGDKQYLLCAHCHDPHSPRFKPIAPEPPPIRPTQAR